MLMAHRSTGMEWIATGCLLLAGLQAAVAAEPAATLETIDAQPSWRLSTKQVRLAITQRGGHMAPVEFLADTAEPVQPYHISPWQNEKLALDVPVLVPLRGDWFCVPFGGNGTLFKGETHPPHGEIAGAEWSFVKGGSDAAKGIHSLTLECATRARPGKIRKELFLVDGHNVVYSANSVEGFAGPAPCGHHATLAMPEAEGVFRIATSPIQFGMTCPGVFSDPAKREYQSFASGARFSDLKKVPLQFKDAPDADVTRLPARRGYADLLQVVNVPEGTAWTAATRTDKNWLWFALKDPKVLRSTVFWIENGGRHGSPWNGRNNCLGMEDVTALFAEGLAPSAAPNVLSEQGVPTVLEFSATKPTTVRYIQGLTRVPAGFGQVQKVEFAPGKATFIGEQGARVDVPVRHEFLATGNL